MAGPPTSSTLEAKKVVCSVGAAIPATLKALKTLPDLEDDNDLDDQLNRNPRMNKKMKKAQEEKGFLTIQKAKKEIERRKAQDAAAGELFLFHLLYPEHIKITAAKQSEHIQ